ncbi:MAG: hypothetical protein J2P19_09955 [Pseudonocardia sp.]|nr:hypothetical protein [Pseudonocardia sp.]
MSVHEGVSGAEGMSLDDILAAMEPDPARLVVRNEFAAVAVSVRGSGPGCTGLRVEDLRTRQVVELDALELESLAWARHRDLAPLLDPGRTRWANGTTVDEES